MKWLTALAAGLFTYILVLIVFLVKPAPAPVAAVSQSINLTTYLQQKEPTTNRAKLSFAALTAHAAVLGASTEAVSNVDSGKEEPKLEVSESSLTQNHYTIAVLGDSMVDTLGATLPHLMIALKERLPHKSFTLLNYGAGATNIESGLTRLTNDYDYLGEHKKALLSQNPNIVVVESFAYNHWEGTQSDLDRQWLTINKIIETIKTRNPSTKIVLAATIAPYCPTYTDGSANLPPERKYTECETVKKYLQNMVNFATSQKYPLADAYHASLSGSDGNPKYINQGDHIHPSDTGKALFSQKLAQAIDLVVN